jgi:hypothetical protein
MQPIDTLGVTERELLHAIDMLNQREGDAPERSHRVAERMRFQTGGGLPVTVFPRVGEPCAYRVWPRNISAEGLAFLHGALIYPGSTCVLRLCGLNGRPVDQKGVIVRCDHVFGKFHDVGVMFELALELGQFVSTSAPRRDAAEDASAHEVRRALRQLRTMLDRGDRFETIVQEIDALRALVAQTAAGRSSDASAQPPRRE